MSNPIATDDTGRKIYPGDTVMDDQGFEGPVLFANCAWRYDVRDGQYLDKNSSLLFKDTTGTQGLKVVRRGDQ